MINRIIRHIVTSLLTFSFILPSVAASEIELNDLALPTDVKDMSKTTGSVYYSPTTKNKALMPVHFWGEVGKPGLHFVPLDTKLVKGISFAGGGNSSAKLEEVNVTRLEGGKVKKYEFDLSEGGDTNSYQYTLQPGDTVFIEKDRFYENRTYYTSLVSVLVTILSGLFILKRLEER